MKHLIHPAIAAIITVVIMPAPTVDAGGHFGLHISNAGFGVTVGVGDWGVYTGSWSDPNWRFSFSTALSGYGEWIHVAGLGRVWRPWVEVGWRPYTHGRWVLTSYGWTWVAYEPWGYFPHHYGSWAYCGFGWVWQPGYLYRPANVVWVQSGGFIGWYARPPHGWSHAAHGFHHGYRHGYADGYRDGWHDARYATWVDWHHVAADNVSHYAVTHASATRGARAAQAVAPSTTEVLRRGGVTVPRRTLSHRTVTVEGRQVTVARPDHMADSVSRHAEETVRGTLAPAALERRQPTVRSRRDRPSTSAASSTASRHGYSGTSRRPSASSEDSGAAAFGPARSPSSVRPGSSGASPRAPSREAPGRAGTTRNSGSSSSRGSTSADHVIRDRSRDADHGHRSPTALRGIESRSRPAPQPRPDTRRSIAARRSPRSHDSTAGRRSDPVREDAPTAGTPGARGSAGTPTRVQRPPRTRSEEEARSERSPSRARQQVKERAKPRRR